MKGSSLKPLAANLKFSYIFIIHTLLYYWKWIKINENVWNENLEFGDLESFAKQMI